jgi:HSP20 family molecular chaperone IbpA
MKSRTVSIDQIPSKPTASPLLAERMSGLLEKVRTRAYELFDRRGRENGHDLDDWFQAENELGALTTARIDESETETRIHIERAEFSADQLKVYAEAQAITVEGASVQTVASDGSPQTSVTERTLFGRYELPTMINAASVTATLQNGVLEIFATKAEPAVEQAKDGPKPTPLKPRSGDRSAVA